MDEIKTLYTQKVEENNAILNSYTKNKFFENSKNF